MPDTMMPAQGTILDAAFRATSHAMLITDAAGHIQAVNGAFTAITGWTQEQVIGQNPSILSSGRQRKSFYRQMWQQLVETGHWSGEIWNRRQDGELYAEWLSIDAIRDRDGQTRHYVGVFSDITAQKRRETDLEWRSLHDPLTGLPNRVLLHDRIVTAIELARRDQSLVGVMAIDLDGFKQVNDSHGHAVGDQLLVVAAKRIRTALRRSDTVARLGGDEFAVTSPTLPSIRRATIAADRILASLRDPFDIDDHRVTISASMGIAYYPFHGERVDDLLKAADTAMYAAKQDGKDRVRSAA